MSDNLPPDDGPDPDEGQDLDPVLAAEDDSVLSGDADGIPEGLQPVARTMDALRAAPVRANLAGEAAARAAFRQIMLAGQSGSAGGTGDSRTLILPTGSAGGGPRAAAGRHRRRRPPRRGHWQAKALAGVAAAAVVIVGATALASTLSGSGSHPAQSGRSPGVTSATTQATAPGSHAVDGSATPASATKPTPKTSQQSGGGTGPSPRELCREYFAFFGHQGPDANWTTESKLVQQLSLLAGGPYNVSGYCKQLLEPWSAVSKVSAYYPGMPGYLPPGDSQGSQGSHSGNGNSGNGNDQSNNGPSSVGQNQP